MLNAMRSGTHSKIIKVVLFGLLAFAMLGLALLDPNASWRHLGHPNSVATIGHDSITTAEFDSLLQSAMRREKMNPQEAYRSGFPEQFLGEEINSRVLSKAVKDLGLAVDDVTAARQLKKLLAPYVKQGLSPQEAESRILYALNLNEAALVETIKTQVGIENLMRALSTGISAPAQMVDDATKYRFESRAGEYFTITGDEADKIPAPADADLKKYYDEISDRFTLPEYRTLAILVIDRKTLGGQDGPTAESMKAWYDAHTADYAQPEKRVISQVVATDEATAKAVYAAASANKDLKAAAAAAGKGKANYIKSAEYGKDDIAVEIADKAFAGKEGTVLEPVKSPLGWHVMYVEKVKAAKPRPFEEAKADIERDMTQASSSSSDALYAKANQIEDMVAGGKTLADVAQSLGLHEKVFEKIDAKGNPAGGAKVDTTGIPEVGKALDSGFKQPKGAVSSLIETSGGPFLLVETRDIVPSQQQPLEKVRAEVVKSWQKEQAAKSLDQKSAKILERLKMGEDFASLASSLGKHVERTEMSPRREKPGSKIPHGVVPALFSLDKIGQVTVVPQENSAMILRLADRHLDVPQQQSKEDMAALKAMLDHSVQKDILEQYRQSLIAKYDVTINHQALNEMYANKGATDEPEDQ